LEISPEQHAFRRRDPTSTLALGPSNAPSRLRGELLVLPVLFFLETVLGNEKPAVAGELRGSVHGDHRAGEEANGRPPPGSLGAIMNR
jgi:hypothetical protein